MIISLGLGGGHPNPHSWPHLPCTVHIHGYLTAGRPGYRRFGAVPFISREAGGAGAKEKKRRGLPGPEDHAALG